MVEVAVQSWKGQQRWVRRINMGWEGKSNFTNILFWIRSLEYHVTSSTSFIEETHTRPHSNIHLGIENYVVPSLIPWNQWKPASTSVLYFLRWPEVPVGFTDSVAVGQEMLSRRGACSFICCVLLLLSVHRLHRLHIDFLDGFFPFERSWPLPWQHSTIGPIITLRSVDFHGCISLSTCLTSKCSALLQGSLLDIQDRENTRSTHCKSPWKEHNNLINLGQHSNGEGQMQSEQRQGCLLHHLFIWGRNRTRQP